MTWATLSVLVPVVAGGVLALAAPVERRAVAGIVAVGAAVATVALTAVLLARVGDGRVIAWWGGWEPRHGVALGIDVAADGLGTGLAVFVAVLAVPTFVLAGRIVQASLQLFFAVALLFVGAMIAFCLTGDLFNLFVAFELMSVAAYVLVGYEIRERAPLAGATTFAVTNSVGSILLLVGIALLYGRTGVLNLAQLGRELHDVGPDGAVLVAFALVSCGLFVKAAVVPFHFWTADAYAVAPTPVLILLGGVFSELGLYAFARLWWTVFDPALGAHDEAIRAILVGFGTLTALLGAVMALVQHHFKRLLAFLVVSQIGLFLVGIGLLRADALAGTAIFVGGDGLVKATLFITVGALQHRYERIEVHDLHGRGRADPVFGVLYGLAALAVAGLPPFGTFLGKAMLEDAALAQSGYGWVPATMALVGALAGAALLIAGGRVFGGLGPPAPREQRVEPAADELADEAERDLSPWLGPTAAVLLAAALGWGLVPGLEHHVAVAAARFTDTAGYAAAVLGGHVGAAAVPVVHRPGLTAYLYAAGSVACALGLAGVALAGRRLPDRLRRGADVLHAVHSGRVGDYVAWAVGGAAALGALVAVAAR
jgi:multicomponent Na+:H+ antiporter subunit D